MISVFPDNFDLPNGKYRFNNENYTAQKRKDNQHPRDYYVIEKKDNKYIQIEPKPTKTNTIRLIDFSPMKRKHRRKERKQEAFIYVESNRFGLLYYLLPFEATSSSPSATSSFPSTTSSSPSATSSSPSATSSSPSATSSSPSSPSSSTSSTPNSISNNENNLSDFFESDSE